MTNEQDETAAEEWASKWNFFAEDCEFTCDGEGFLSPDEMISRAFLAGLSYQRAKGIDWKKFDKDDETTWPLIGSICLCYADNSVPFYRYEILAWEGQDSWLGYDITQYFEITPPKSEEHNCCKL